MSLWPFSDGSSEYPDDAFDDELYEDDEDMYDEYDEDNLIDTMNHDREVNIEEDW